MRRLFFLGSLLLSQCGLFATPCFAIDYNEATSGDLSNNRLSTTSLGTLTPGSNDVFGTTGNAGGVDRDYFTFHVPPGFQLASLTVLPQTTSGGAFSFIGMQAGSQITVPFNATSAAGLLGWTHYRPADINTNILPRMGVPANGSTGFTPPLNAGSYSFWIQDVSAGTFAYRFRFEVQSAPNVSLSGNVTLESVSNAANPLTFVFIPQIGSTFSRTVTPQANGNYSVTDLPPRIYTVGIKGDKWLRKNQPLDATGGNVTNFNATLRGGDANNDNFVDITDLLTLIAHYNQTAPATEYLEAADFNEDGTNDITDLLLLIGNYNQQGDGLP
jgi:hypothetical protein